MNSIKTILEKQLVYQDRLEIKNLGPPRPELSLSQTSHTKNRTYTRNFSAKLYDKSIWLAGCAEKNAFYCFCCVLFGSQDTWATTGVVDLKHLDDKIKKHSVSKLHLQNEMNMAMLGQVDIRQQLDEGYRRSIQKHKELVEKNRYILSRIIDCIKFCGFFELSLRGHDESTESENPGVFRGLLDFVACLDNVVREHLESSNVFKGTSKTIQNEILDAMLTVAHAFIKDEVKKTEYLAIQADETTDISCTTQMSIVIRYQIEGDIFERFWGYFPLTDRTAGGISSVILELLKDLGVDKNPGKLIAQTYDGAAVMSGTTAGVQQKVKDVYPYANFVHCYAHQGNLIMQQATSASKDVRIFFSDVQGIPPFFSRSPKRTDILNEVVKKKLPQAAPTRWNFQSRSVNTIYEHRESLIECFDRIREIETDSKTISLASGFIRLLQDETFIFWLKFFHTVMPHVDTFFNQIQKKKIEPTDVRKFTSDFVSAVEKIRNTLCDNKIEVCEVSEPTSSKKRRTSEGSSCSRLSAIEVCDVIIAQARRRFEFTNHLSAALLFLPESFKIYDKTFPNVHYLSAVEAFPFVDKKRLKTELEVMYSREDLRSASGACALLEFLLQNNLKSVFSESVTLLKIIVTIPMTSVENERCFSTLKRIKSFLRNTMLQDRLNSLAMLSISKKMIRSIPGFNQLVIDEFAKSKHRKLDFSCVPK